MKVLLAEDDPGIREGLADLISERAPVVAVTTVEEALEALEFERFGLVIADMRLGGEQTGGRRVAERARKDGSRVVVMSGLTQPDMNRALGGVPIDGVLPKPFSIDDALEIVDRFLGH